MEGTVRVPSFRLLWGRLEDSVVMELELVAGMWMKDVVEISRACPALGRL